MKYSIYNTTLTILGKHTLLFNALSGKFVVLRNKIFHPEDEMPSQIAANDKGLYAQLLESGIIIGDDIDEVKTLQEIINQTDDNAEEFILHVNPTLDCNFKCWYCYENHVEKSIMSENILKSTKRFIKKTLENEKIKKFEFGFFGGEPLIGFSKVAKPLIAFAGEICKRKGTAYHIHFTSNGALLTPSIIAFLTTYSCGFQITLDGGQETHDKTRFSKKGQGSYERIVQNIKRLLEAQIDVIIRVNYTSENIGSVAAILGSFSGLTEEQKRRARFDFQRVWQNRTSRTDDTERKIQSIREKFEAQGFSVLTNYLAHDVRSSCYGDKLHHVLLNYDGLAFGCTARDFIPANSIGQLAAEGIINYIPEILNKRNSSKFSKAICHTCRIAPLCGGGCKQRAFEDTDENQCTLHYTQADMDDIVLTLFDHTRSGKIKYI